MRFWLGTTVRAEVAFVGGDGEPMAATGVAFTARRPAAAGGGTVAADAVPAAAAGVFRADFLPDAAGTWWVRAECAGPVPAADERPFDVVASHVLAG